MAEKKQTAKAAKAAKAKATREAKKLESKKLEETKNGGIDVVSKDTLTEDEVLGEYTNYFEDDDFIVDENTGSGETPNVNIGDVPEVNVGDNSDFDMSGSSGESEGESESGGEDEGEGESVDENVVAEDWIEDENLRLYISTAITNQAQRAVDSGLLSLDLANIRTFVEESCNQCQYGDYDRAMKLAIKCIGRVSTSLLM